MLIKGSVCIFKAALFRLIIMACGGVVTSNSQESPRLIRVQAKSEIIQIVVSLFNQLFPESI